MRDDQKTVHMAIVYRKKRVMMVSITSLVEEAFEFITSVYT